MTPGDIPCNARCSWRWCRYWSDGHCADTDVCERWDGNTENESASKAEEGEEE